MAQSSRPLPRISNRLDLLSREELQVKKALDNLRGTMEKEKEEKVEVETNEPGINPHVPKFIVQAPWYLNQKEQNMDHQKSHVQNTKIDMDQWYQRGIRKQVAFTYRKGACENCGAMTHKTKDCCERPRKLGAKYSGKDIAPDEVVQQFTLNWDAKRDRWNGYDPNMYKDVINDYQQLEDARRELRQKELASGKITAEDENEDFKEKLFDNNAPVPNVDPRTKTNIRNLRIREDVAKYLLNLDEEVAAGNGRLLSIKNVDGSVEFGDDPTKWSGDTHKLLDQEKFVQDLLKSEKAELNSVALPTATEMIFRKAREKLSEAAIRKNEQLTKRYGTLENSEANDLKSLLFQTEHYVEYNKDGKPAENKSKAPQGKSKYEEDILTNDHCAVWGSWWNEEFGWGYACCYITVKNSQCLGERNKKSVLLKEMKIKKAREEELRGFAKQTGVDTLKEDHEQNQIIKEDPEPKKTEDPILPIFSKSVALEPENKGTTNFKSLNSQEIIKEESPKKVQKNTKRDSSSSSSSSSSSDSSSSSSSSSSRSSSAESRSRSREKEKLQRNKQGSAQKKLDDSDKKRTHQANEKERGKGKDEDRSRDNDYRKDRKYHS